PSARPEGGVASPFLAHLSWRQVMPATAIVFLGLAAGFQVVVALFVCAGSVVVVLLARQGFCRWIGGVTGDTLGATNEVVEILFLLCVPLLLRLL
ncbi:MAG: adenosylcobinamide-GDP ribazoletransferase, partial [Nitrospira sp.]|nr:adenosylcobinamide-GDP ribazoletransferase [Nitrospira sp.]